MTDIMSFAEFKARNEEAKKKYGDSTLGSLCWFSVPVATMIDHSVLQKAVTDGYQGLERFAPVVPPEPRVVDVFKRACTDAEAKRVPVYDSLGGPDGTFYNYSVRPAGTDPDYVWRMIVREHIDPEGHELDYVNCLLVRFTRNDGTILFTQEEGSPTDDSYLPVMRDTLIKYFNAHRETLTSLAIRSVIRSSLEARLHAIQVRPSGGVYFVSRGFDEPLEAIEGIINDISGCTFHSLPLLDDVKQRTMLKAAFENEATDAIDSLIAQMQEATTGNNDVSVDRFADFKATYDELRTKVAEYSDVLEVALEDTAIRLEVCSKFMKKMLNQVTQ